MPELVGEGGAGPLVGRERVGLAAGAVLRGHEQRPERLAHRVPAHQRLELGDRRRDTGSPEIGRDAAFEGIQPQRAQSRSDSVSSSSQPENSAYGRPRHRLSASARMSLASSTLAVEQCRAAPSDLALEDESVDVVRRDVEDVAVPAGADDVGHPAGHGAAARRGTAGSRGPQPAAPGPRARASAGR